MTFVRKAALAAAGLAAVAVPLMIGLVRAQDTPQIEAATIKPAAPRHGPDQGGVSGGPGTRSPGLFKMENMSLVKLMAFAHNVKRFQIVAPGWMNTVPFDVTAKVPRGATWASFRPMLQNLLADRFQIVIHRETRESQVFDLVQAKGGHKLEEYVEDPAGAGDAKKSGRGAGRSLQPGMVLVRTGRGADTGVESRGMSMAQIVGTLSNYVGRPVVDATGLTGKYNVKLHFSREGLAGPAAAEDEMGRPAGASDPTGAPTLFKAVQEQLGLKLEQKKGTIEIIVIDKAEKTPTAN